MRELKQINIKNRTYYFYNDMINNIGYITITKNDEYESIYSVNPLYLRVNHANEYIEEKNGNKYLIFDSTGENKDLLKKYNDIWNGIKNKINAINVSECDYEKDFVKLSLILVMNYY